MACTYLHILSNVNFYEIPFFFVNFYSFSWRCILVALEILRHSTGDHDWEGSGQKKPQCRHEQRPQAP